MFVRVAINIPSYNTFLYSVPELLEKEIATGVMVFVSFGKRKLTGYVIETTSSVTCEDIDVKDIIAISDCEPLFNEADLRFYQWVSRYYIHPVGKALADILPGGREQKSIRWISLSKDVRENTGEEGLSTLQGAILETLDHFPSGLSLARLKEITGGKDMRYCIKALGAKGLIVVEDRLRQPEVILKKEKIVTLNMENISSTKLTEKQGKLIDFLGLHGSSSLSTIRQNFKNVSSFLRGMEKKKLIFVSEQEVCRTVGVTSEIGKDKKVITLNENQKSALEEIINGLSSGQFSTYLLHGVTGSGKTEVYLNAMEEAIRLNGGVIFLVPEIALTPQLVRRLNERFQDQEIALLHSGISRKIRYEQWRRIQRGEIRIVAGARSAVFAPVRNLKLIIIDEEHDTSYKQEERTRYNARDLAIVKAKNNSAVVVLGSATPEVQSYFNAREKKYHYLSLPERVENRPLPKVEIVDMRGERDKSGKVPILSQSLKEAIHDTIQAGKQTLLFLNRRGYSSFMLCLDCGYVFKCQNCAVSMTYHAYNGFLKCHYCDCTIKAPPLCNGCHGSSVFSYGVGTERVEEEVKKLFPQARVGRMDSDTTTRKGSCERILEDLYRQEIDILIGTQMITKGHDFPAITLVGVISADTSLNIPDFRAGERTFQLLTQVSGRGGRGDSPARVIIQTFNPGHYAIRRAKEHDYTGFYEDELPLRESLRYPPFSRIIAMHIQSAKKEQGMKGIENIRKEIRNLCKNNTAAGEIEIIGPAEAPIARIRGKYRWQLLLKGKDIGILHALTKDLLTRSMRSGLDIKVDVDPVNFM
ncbi:MAG: primosomal protein N' [Syntrophales bacterium]